MATLDHFSAASVLVHSKERQSSHFYQVRRSSLPTSPVANLHGSDILKRHAKTCGSKATDQSIFRESSRKRRKACNRCSHQKRKCDSKQPCQGCLGKQADCTYSNINEFSLRPSNYHGNVSELGNGSPAPLSIVNTSSVVRTEQENNFGVFQTSPQSLYEFPDALDFATDLGTLFADVSDSNLLSTSLMSDGFSASDTGCHISIFSFPFLEKFTRTTGFVNSFVCGTLEQRQRVVESIEDIYTQRDLEGAIYDLSSGTATLTAAKDDSSLDSPQESCVWGYQLTNWENMPQSCSSGGEQATVQPQYTRNWKTCSPASVPLQISPRSIAPAAPIHFAPDMALCRHWSSDQLALKTYEIVSRIKEVVMVKPRNSIVTINWTGSLEKACFQFFSPLSLRQHLHLYWASWHPNWPVIHKPTFDPQLCPPTLLAAMVIIGACMSPDISINESARVWFDPVEEMTFVDNVFCADYGACDLLTEYFASASVRESIQALQAAYAVCLFQNWEGTDVAKRRIRRHRYNTVVSTARDMNIAGANHQDLDRQIQAHFDWNDFVAREELIRTMIYIFLLDTGFIIFNNLPPRMAVKELNMDLACPEPCFQATTSAKCLAQVRIWVTRKTWSRRMSLYSALEILCRENIDQQTLEVFADLGILNLFALSSGLHSLIFQRNQISFSHQPRFTSIHNALANWRVAWQLSEEQKLYNELVQTMDEKIDEDMLQANEMWTRVGFMKNALEFWMLARISLDRAESTALDSKQTDSQDRRHEDNPQILNKYDETSMGQIHDLITSFQRVNLGIANDI